jgi:predicted RNA-binding Zn-ribbon protein involved in translation (DUF1610 family)
MTDKTYTAEQVESEADHLYLLVGMSKSYLMLRAYAATLRQSSQAVAVDEVREKCRRIQENRDYWYGVAQQYREELHDARVALAKLVTSANLMLAEIDTCGHEVDSAYRLNLYDAREQGKAALARQASSGEAGGTFACPICGFDKPHHHPEYDRMPVPFPSDPRNPQGVYGWVSDHIRHASGEYAVYNYLPPDQRTSRTIPLRAAMIDSSYTHPDEPVKVADGYVLVPREPTEAMLKAAYPLHWWDSPGQRLKQDYQKMLAATPGADGEAV